MVRQGDIQLLLCLQSVKYYTLQGVIRACRVTEGSPKYMLITITLLLQPLSTSLSETGT